METIGRILDLVARALAAIAAAAGAAIFAFILAAVVMRYLVAAPFRFTEELSGLLLAMMVFLAMPMALVRDLNIRVTLVTVSLPALARRVAWVASELILVAFAAGALALHGVSGVARALSEGFSPEPTLAHRVDVLAVGAGLAVAAWAASFASRLQRREPAGG